MFTRLTLIASLLALVTSLALAQKDVGKKYALLIGVNVYSTDTLPNLKYAENDAEELAKVLDGYEVIVLTASRGKTNRELLPTAKNIEAALLRLLKGKTKHDTILIALAGHGMQLEKADKNESNVKNFPMFCPSDAQLNDTDYDTGKSPTLINLDHLLERVGECGAGSKLLLIDACRNDVKSRARNVNTDSIKIPTGVAVLYSCSKGQRAFETPKRGKGHGVFFHHVIETLKGDDSVTWSHLASRVIDRVAEDVPEVIGGGAKQEPHEVRSGGRAPVIIERSEAEGLYRQGLAAFLGEKDAIDEAKALKLFRRAAEKKHVLAAAWVGRLVYLGRGTTPDKVEGEKQVKAVLPALRRLAETHGDAQYLLGNFSEDGIGATEDAKDALQWYRKAADKGHALAKIARARTVIAANYSDVIWFGHHLTTKRSVKFIEEKKVRDGYTLSFKFFWDGGIIKNQTTSIRFLVTDAGQISSLNVTETTCKWTPFGTDLTAADVRERRKRVQDMPQVKSSVKLLKQADDADAKGLCLLFLNLVLEGD